MYLFLISDAVLALALTYVNTNANVLRTFRIHRVASRLIPSTIGICVCCIILVFIISNISNNTPEVESTSVKCNCPSTQNSFPQTTVLGSATTTTTTQNKAILKPCEEIQKSSPVQRAILIYYPHHQSEYFFPEVRW
ncbi:unnamed protein product [Rotaria sp. Silwood2]|nr:unnamed protein product [Rotaria sp. Silwood2]